MNKDITQNDLILLAYNELPPKKHRNLLKEVLKNEQLTAEYLELLSGLDELDTLSYSPNPTSIQIIMEESAAASKETTHA